MILKHKMLEKRSELERSFVSTKRLNLLNLGESMDCFSDRLPSA
jgi:hypothetical protein